MGGLKSLLCAISLLKKIKNKETADLAPSL